jgi:hypothetical protein
MDSDHIVATYLKAETILSCTDSLEDTDDEK